MKILWTYIENQKWSAETKYHAVIAILGALSATAGLITWLIIRIWALSSWDWMICFAGYPAVISWFAILFYGSHHDFHNGSPL